MKIYMPTVWASVQTIGIGAGQQSRVHCTRLAGNKADIWQLRQHPKILSLPFRKETKLVNRDNAIGILLNHKPEFMIENQNLENLFTRRPQILTSEDKKDWLNKVNGVSLGSDAFFPFSDNIERAVKSGVSYIAQTGGSIRDTNVIDTCNRYNIVMALTGIRLFHH